MTQGPHGHLDPAEAAGDPRTPQTELHRLAAEHPELRPVIAENPNTYQDLLDWMAERGDPDVDAALRRRAAGFQEAEEAEAAHPVAPQPPAGPAYPDLEAQQWAAAPPEADQFFGMQSEPESEERRGGRGVLIVMAALLAVGALVASLVLFLGSPFDDDAETTAEQQPAEEENSPEEGDEPPEQEDTGQQGDPEEDLSPAEEDADLARPAPDGAQEITAFETPSGNIRCEISDDEALCTIAWHEFSAPAGCEGGTTLRVTEDGAEEACGTSVESQPVSLDYEAAATNGDFACESSEEGVECWSTRSGNSFTVAAAGYDLSD